MSHFAKLLSELQGAQAETETLTKSLTADGSAGAGAGGGEGGEGAGAGGEAGAAAGAAGAAGAAAAGEGAGAAGAGEGGQLAKSFKVKTENGEEIEAIDGTELVKALTDRMDQNDSDLMKAFAGVQQLLTAQGNAIKTLVEQVRKIAGEGRGRKTLVTLHDRAPAGGTLAKGGAAGASGGEGAGAGEQGEVTAEQFMSKAQNAFDQGLITGLNLTTIDVCLRSGQPVAKELISKVMKAKAAD